MQENAVQRLTARVSSANKKMSTKNNWFVSKFRKWVALWRFATDDQNQKTLLGLDEEGPSLKADQER